MIFILHSCRSDINLKGLSRDFGVLFSVKAVDVAENGGFVERQSGLKSGNFV